MWGITRAARDAGERALLAQEKAAALQQELQTQLWARAQFEHDSTRVVLACEYCRSPVKASHSVCCPNCGGPFQ